VVRAFGFGGMYVWMYAYYFVCPSYLTLFLLRPLCTKKTNRKQSSWLH
jgi:hypothetical protein